jgi:hypothetical protein
VKLTLRRWLVLTDQKLSEEGRPADPPLRKVAAVAVIENPFAGKRVEDLSPAIEASAELGRFLSEKALEAMAPYHAESYGKGAVAGMAGVQEHANALITTTFAEPLRSAVGGGKAWISSYTKIAAPGCSIDIPLAHKDALYVRSHYDGMTVFLPDAPMPDEIAVLVCIANRGRIEARVGGLKADEIKRYDGLR